MGENEKRALLEGENRRWIQGSGQGEFPEDATAILRLAAQKTKRWKSIAKALRLKGVDQVDAERRLLALLDAGLVEIHERRNRRGDFEPYEWRLTDAAQGLLEEERANTGLLPLIDAFLDDPGSRGGHPLLEAIRDWLPVHGKDNERASRILMAIARALSSGQRPTERGVSLAAFGNTKVVRIAEYPEVIGEVFGVPPEQVVRRAGQAVYAYGPFAFSIAGRRIDGEWSRPWLAVTAETLEALTDLTVEADNLLTVENLTPFEETVRAGLPPRTVVLYTGGFPGAMEIRMARLLIGAGIDKASHWGDLDLGGLRIFKHLQGVLPVTLSPFRMAPELLDIMPTAPLTEMDRLGLRAWIADDANPLRALASRVLEKNRKAEQEGWFLTGQGDDR